MAESDGPLTIRYVDPRTLQPAERNPRIMPGHEMQALKAALDRWGFVDPIVLRKEDQRIIGGHQRVTAAIELGMELVPVVEADVSVLDAMILNETLNRVHGTWDEPQLALHQQEIRLGGGDLSLTGFTGRELTLLAHGLAEKQGLTHPDALPASAAAPVAERGDLWLCGDHRLMCGDATDRGDVERLLAGAKPGLMVTDPPYGVDYHPEWRQEAAARTGRPTSGFKKGLVTNDDRADWSEAHRLFPGCVAYVWCSGIHHHQVAWQLEAVGFDLRAQIIWVKQLAAFGRGNYHWQHEPIWYAVRQGATAEWIGDRKQTTVWEVANLHPRGGGEEAGQQTEHSTQKPVEVMSRPMRNHQAPEIYDPFIGSGTAMIACERLARRCFGMEIEPAYVDLAVKRWEEFTGRKAEREPTKL